MKNIAFFGGGNISQAVIEGLLNSGFKKNNIYKDKVKLYPFGISDKNSILKMKTKVKFGYVQTGGSSVSNPIEEEGHELFEADFKIGDEVLKLNNQKLAIKIDVERHELSVLKGFVNLLNNNDQNTFFSCNFFLWSKHKLFHLFIIECPRQESNLHLMLRRHLFYPLNYEGLSLIHISEPTRPY